MLTATQGVVLSVSVVGQLWSCSHESDDGVLIFTFQDKINDSPISSGRGITEPTKAVRRHYGFICLTSGHGVGDPLTRAFHSLVNSSGSAWSHEHITSERRS